MIRHIRHMDTRGRVFNPTWPLGRWGGSLSRQQRGRSVSKEGLELLIAVLSLDPRHSGGNHLNVRTAVYIAAGGPVDPHFQELKCGTFCTCAVLANQSSGVEKGDNTSKEERLQDSCIFPHPSIALRMSEHDDEALELKSEEGLLDHLVGGKVAELDQDRASLASFIARLLRLAEGQAFAPTDPFQDNFVEKMFTS